MPIKVNIDTTQFKQDLERTVREQAEKAFKDQASRIQGVLDDVHRRAANHDATEVERLLRSGLSAKGVPLPDKNIKSYAQAIASGHPIKVETKIQW